MSKEAMKLAVRSLKELVPDDSDHAPAIQGQRKRQENAIKALQEALAKQPAQQKPVTPCTHPSLGACSLREDGTASRWNCVMCGTEFVPKATNRWAEFNEATKRNIEHAEWYLSTHPQPAHQEPVAFLANGTRFKISYDSRQSGGQIHGIPPELGGRWVAFVAADDDCHLKLTSPSPQRTWVGLTDEERDDLLDNYITAEGRARAIEAKLRSKNEDRN